MKKLSLFTLAALLGFSVAVSATTTAKEPCPWAANSTKASTNIHASNAVLTKYAPIIASLPKMKKKTRITKNGNVAI